MENPMPPAPPPPPPPPPRRRPETRNSHLPSPPHHTCPRCDSSNTKFCYYNNYNLAQPRYYCRACRRYWTHGGTLRNIPVGGGSRRNRRPRPAVAAAGAGGSRSAPPPPTLLVPIRDNAAPMRAPILPPMGARGSFFTGGAFISSMTAGMISGGALLDFGGGGGGGQYGVSNMALLHNFQSLPPASGDQMFLPRAGLNVNAGRPGLSPWTQNLIRGSSSGGSSSGLRNRASAGEDENEPAPNLFNPKHWSNKNPSD